MVDFAFAPGALTIAAGDTVVWSFDGDVIHTTTGGSWDSGPQQSGGTFARTFPEPGSHPYVCTIHPSMAGTITVTG